MSKLPTTLVHRSRISGELTEIIDQGDLRSLYFASSNLQSRMALNEPHRLVLSYTTFMMFSLLLRTPERVALIGLGAGSLIRFLHHHFPACRIDAVEISAEIIKLAKGFFRLPVSDMISLHCQDGRHFLANCPAGSYDLILLDAFTAQGMAASVYSAACFQLVSAALAKDGFFSCNLWSGVADEQRQIREDLHDHFRHIIYLPVPKRGNCIAFGGARPIDWHGLSRARVTELTKEYGIDGETLVRVARRHNLGPWQRFLQTFVWPDRG